MKTTIKTIYGLMSLIAIVSVSCAKEEVVLVGTTAESDGNIRFSANMTENAYSTRSSMSHLAVDDEVWLVGITGSTASTKASPVTEMSGSVGITAIEYTGEWDESTVYPNTRMKNDEFTYDGGNLHPVTPRAWRNITAGDKIRFFAYAPYHQSTAGLSPMDGSVKGSPYIDYFVPEAAPDQTDLLYANSVENRSEDYTGTFRSTVPLVFKHALTAVQFKVGFDCTVKSLTLHNIVNKGRFTATSPAAWSYPEASKSAFTFSFGDGIAMTEGQFLTKGDSTLMMVPQTFAAVGATPDTENDAYLELVYSVGGAQKTLTAFFGGENGFSWQMGRKLIYTIYEGSVPEVKYIYLDLNAGDVEILQTTYSGKVYVDGTPTTVSGTHSDANKYYIYQSSTISGSPGYYVNTGYTSDQFNTTTHQPVDGASCRIPQYESLTCDGKSWAEYITNNTSPENVENNWNIEAPKVKRSATIHIIKLFASDTMGYLLSSYSSVGPVVKFDITLDNVWSNYFATTGHLVKENITVGRHHSEQVTVRLKGDNKMHSIYYNRRKEEGTPGYLRFNSAVQDGSNDGSLTVTFPMSGEYRVNRTVIGSSWDNPFEEDNRRSTYLEFCGGTIFAGLKKIKGSVWDNDATSYYCGCIGTSNSTSIIKISGGRLTAVSNSSAPAIGGGGGASGQAGEGYVTISGGETYAYSYSVYSTTHKYYVPSTAIGGGSSMFNQGKKGEVTITGGYVYAQSVGGTAIGGGSSGELTGAAGIVTITGGTVIAKSVAGSIPGHPEYSTSASAAIGGGTGGNLAGSNGGDAVVTLSGGTLTTGSIGGGGTKSSNAKIGSADINIYGSAIVTGQFIMAAGAATQPSFTMSGGIIKNSSTSDAECFKIQPNGGAVYMEDGICAINGGTISNCAADRGGAVYMQGGSFSMSGGTIKGNTSTYDGGAVYITGGSVNMTGGVVDGNLTRDGDGGGICIQGGSFTMNGDENDAKIINNAAHADSDLGGNGGDGGGIFVSSTTSDPTVSIIRGTVTANAADKNGGGLAINMENAGTHKATIVIGDETLITGRKTSPYIAANSAALSGGGLFVSGIGSNVWIWSGTTKGNVSAYVTNEDIRNDGGLLYLTDQDDYVDVKNVSITFHANNGSDPETTAVQRVVTNTNSLLTPPDAAKAFTRKYYTFTGWNTKRDGTGTHYSIDGKLPGESEPATMNLSSDLSLYAEWSIN